MFSSIKFLLINISTLESQHPLPERPGVPCCAGQKGDHLEVIGKGKNDSPT